MKLALFLGLLATLFGLGAINLAIVLAVRLHARADRERFPQLGTAAFILGPIVMLGWSAAIGALTKGSEEHRAEHRMARVCRLLSAASLACAAGAIVALFRG